MRVYTPENDLQEFRKMESEKIKLIGNGRKFTDQLLPLAQRENLAAMNCTIVAHEPHVPLKQYLKAVSALKAAENQVEGLETMVEMGIPFNEETTCEGKGYYHAFWINQEVIPKALPTWLLKYRK